MRREKRFYINPSILNAEEKNNNKSYYRSVMGSAGLDIPTRNRPTLSTFNRVS